MNNNEFNILYLQDILKIIDLTKDGMSIISEPTYPDIDKIEKGLSNSELDGKEKEIIIKSRVNQGVFREQLLKRYGKCCLCSITNSSLIIASHIKPWSESEATEKLDVENGFLFCPNHDKLFDSGLISFDDNGQIIISKSLNYNDLRTLNLSENMKIDVTEENKKYLSYHRKYIFRWKVDN